MYARSLTSEIGYADLAEEEAACRRPFEFNDFEIRIEVNRSIYIYGVASTCQMSKNNM